MNTIAKPGEQPSQLLILPPELQHMAGKVLDPDTHMMLPAQEWVSVLGSEFRDLAEHYIEHGETEEEDKNTANVPGFEGDVAPVDAEVVNRKGVRSPGAFDPARRLAVMDAMGVSQQLLFPTYPAVFLGFLYSGHDDQNCMSYITGDRRAKAIRWLDIHNDWLLSCAVSDRIRPVPFLFGSTPEEIIARAKNLIGKGARALWLTPAGELPGGVSPAHPDLDPLWAVMAEANCVLINHIAGGGRFLSTERWQDAPAFEGYVTNTEFSRSPWFTSQFHLPFENLLATMVLGGVFDRHPTLRFGVIESACYWVGPLMARLDLWHSFGGDPTAGRKAGGRYNPKYHLPEKPSFYFNRNVRVTPFPIERDIALDVERYGLDDILCFSSDYPHVEGGKYAASTFYKKLEGLGPEFMQKFYIENSRLLFPD